MKILSGILKLLPLFILLEFNASSCIKKPDVPVVVTSEMTDVTRTNAIARGYVVDDNGADITESGICWSTNENPETADSRISCSPGKDSFIIRITNLLAETKYYVRAYATNKEGTGYGNQVVFTTGEIGFPEVLTTSAFNIGLTSASSGGLVYDAGGGQVSQKGVCWSKTHSPTIMDSRTIDDYLRIPFSPAGVFTSVISALEPRTQYYVRSYATNGAGTSYGNEISFTTLSVNPPTFNTDKIYGSVTDIDGNIYKTVQIGNRTWMAENLKTTRLRDGSAIPLQSRPFGGSSPAMFWFNYDQVNYKDIYGGYYNIYAVNTKLLCPEGWHVPDKTDWSESILILGNEGLAGGMMKESGTLNWMSPNYGATNESGFTGLPGGYIRDKFIQHGISGYWWSTNQNKTWSGTYYDSNVLEYRFKSISIMTIMDSGSGLNVRCVKD